MSELVKTMKLHIHVDKAADILFKEMTEAYRSACNSVSAYVFDNGFEMNSSKLSRVLYHEVRGRHGLKSQLAQSVFKTVTARYKTVKEQLYRKPYRYLDEEGDRQCITRTLEWLMKPVRFSRPQADLVRDRDYSFVQGRTRLSINTLDKRIRATFDVPECFEEYFDGSWSFGTARLVSLKGEWYLHIPMTKRAADTFDPSKPGHVVGLDRGLRFLYTSYDETGKTVFANGKDILDKRERFLKVRAELQKKGTRSAKRRLKAISGRENRWMSDVNHQLTKTLVSRYGSDTLFVIEDLSGVSFDEKILSRRDASGRRDVRSWAFFQFEQFLAYKAKASGSGVLKVSAEYTSQRCPRCGRIRRGNRDHRNHLYVCDSCGYRSNDDRVGAMNIYTLGTLFVSGDSNPRFGVRKTG